MAKKMTKEEQIRKLDQTLETIREAYTLQIKTGRDVNFDELAKRFNKLCPLMGVAYL